MTVRIAVVGVGFGVQVHAPAFQSEGLEVVAVCSRRQARAAAAAEQLGVAGVFTDYDELLAMAGLDAVSITTPAALHHPMTIAALRAGKHVICEKPFARSAAEAREMADLAAALGLTGMVAHEFRFASGRMRVAELIEEGFVGRPTLATVRVLRGPTKRAESIPAYEEDGDSADAGGGFLFRMGSHFIDGLRHWLGEVRSVEARLLTVAPERMRDGAVVMSDADDSFLVMLEFASGAIAEVLGSRSMPFAAEADLMVAGTDGILLTPQRGMNPPAHGVVLGARLGVDAEPAPLEIPARLEPFTDDRDDRLMPFRLMTREFLRGIEEGTSPAPSFEDGFRCMQILDAVRTSSREGRRVALAG